MARSLRDDDVFQAIAHPMRRAILESLMDGEKPATELAAPFGVTMPAVSQQLQVLRRVGLVSDRRVGRQRLYRLLPGPLDEVQRWLAFFQAFWTGKLGALGEHLKRTHGARN